MTGAGRSLRRAFFRHPNHGSLPALLLALTVVTGLLDAASILALGHVFVANMTGNVVFIGFALAGAPGFSLAGSLLALAGFLAGAAVTGAFRRRVPRRGRLLAVGVTVELGLLLLATASVLVTGQADGVEAVAVTLLAIGLGVRNAVVRHLAVPDLTTTVLTMSLTGVGADLRSGQPIAALRRILSVVAMLVGATAGAVLVRTVDVVAALLTAAVLLAAVAVIARYAPEPADPA